MNDILDEIKLMEDALTADIDTSSTDLPTDESVATEPPATQPPVEESVKEEPKTDAPSTDAPTTDAPVDELTQLRATVEELRGTVEKLTKPTERTKDEPDTRSTAPPVTVPPLTEDFLGDQDPYDIVHNKETFNTILNTVANRVATLMEGRTREQQQKLIQSIPLMVRNNVSLVNNLVESSREFYKNNKDLEPFKKVVAAVYEETAAEHPDKTVTDILEIVGPEVRKRLDLQKKAGDKKGDNDKNVPRLPRKKGSGDRPTQQKPETSSIQNEIAEMDKALNQ